MLRRPPPPPLFPYTTLFRSARPARSVTTTTTGSTICSSATAAQTCCTTTTATAPSLTSPSALAWQDREHAGARVVRSEEHTSELQSLRHLVCRLLLEKKKRR